QVCAHGLELGDDGGVIAVADVDTLEQGDLDTFLAKAVTDLRGDTAAIGLLVVQNGNRLGLERFSNVASGKGTLLVVAADGTEEVMRLDGVGDQRRGGARGDGNDAFVLVHVHGWNSGAGAGMGYGKLGAGVDHAVGSRYGLLGFAAVIDEQRLELLAVDAARLVECFDGGEGARLDLVTVLGGGTGHGLGNTDLDGIGIDAACEGQGPDGQGKGLDADK